jgi:hypothetical protein
MELLRKPLLPDRLDGVLGFLESHTVPFAVHLDGLERSTGLEVSLDRRGGITRRRRSWHGHALITGAAEEDDDGTLHLTPKANRPSITPMDMTAASDALEMCFGPDPKHGSS